MRLSKTAIPFGAFLVAALLCWQGARYAVHALETASVGAVDLALEEAGQGGLEVLGDGLLIVLEGEVQSEAARLRAMNAAGTVVDASRVIDNMSVAENAPIAPPDFSVEILRNDSGVSLIGLIPSNSDRDGMSADIADLAGGADRVADFLEAADYPVPPDWPDAMGYALRALEQLPRSKISVRAGHVSIEAIADSDEERARLETSLRRTIPDQVEVALAISSPRPVVTPFTVRFIHDGEGGRFDACVADTDAGEALIVAAAEAAGLQGQAGCTIALGAPSRRWGEAVALAIEAVADLGGGTVTISDADVTLVALPGAVQGNFERVAGELENDLPEIFALEAVLPAAPGAADQGPPQFIATLSPEGLVQLRGRVSDELLNATAENYARARFGTTEIAMGTRMVDGLPQGWSIRVLAGIEALSKLSNGSVVVEPDRLIVRGNTGNARAGAEISRLLIDKLGSAAEFEIEVTYVEQLDPISALPTPEECVDQIIIATDARKITFDPGSANISGAAIQVVDDIAEILRRCADLRLEIAGYTDSQGSEEGNQRLSQQRAEAVLTALRARRVPTSSFEPRGYGEADPIADNETEEGREANRRIEFRLIVPEPIAEEPTTLEEIAAEEAAAEDQGTDEE
ncbi:MAG: OmpA-OmpF porin, OOP family [Rhodobacteraceae bacterium HLUCCA08]|nr:MAG: OmpA-OmpF porin, OOP family [Rhodobacteraceae bacterium HLUCCA08]